MDEPVKVKGQFAKNDSRINRNGRPKHKENFINGRDNKLYHRYGIRLAEYERLLAKQNGVCAICGKPEVKMQARKKGGAKVVDSLQVDHDHITGKVRGLICWKCNVSIVKLLDNRELSEKAAKYLGIDLNYSG